MEKIFLTGGSVRGEERIFFDDGDVELRIPPSLLFPHSPERLEFCQLKSL